MRDRGAPLTLLEPVRGILETLAERVGGLPALEPGPLGPNGILEGVPILVGVSKVMFTLYQGIVGNF